MRRLQESILRLRNEGRTGLVACLVAGDPDPGTTLEILLGLPAAGADAVELVVPFSDPVADGPTIVAAHGRAMAAGADLETTLGLAASFRAAHPQVPLLLMSYLNPVLSLGPEEFCARLSRAGGDGVVLVDLPLEHRKPWLAAAQKSEIALVAMWAPTADDGRARRILSGCGPLAYLVARTGGTGKGEGCLEEVRARAKWSRSIGGPALMAGFGIRTKRQLQELSPEVEFAVVATRLVEELKEGGAIGASRLLAAVRALSGKD